ncbi:RNA polymerase sigma-70 factor [Sphingobacterium faecale]|uniref:RNA polymerase sigma-70 factor n=1 Tax=Sphingobacterium faecale TaxID=2803775 RepID=A0ABS1R5M8_9SPHI|nr:RNA polymerase sigma-70 factor [Sphingobacterium faecale]MBL1409800.1 RNA polymerase sigma-70 factor [Sphingobacterium faecale]
MQIDFKNLGKDKKSWEYVYEHFYQKLCFFSNDILNDREKAADVVQSILIKIWQENMAFDSFQHLRNYLYKSVQNATINELNKDNSRSRILKGLGKDNPDIYRQEDHFYTIVRAEVYKQIGDAVNQLPEKTRQVFNLAFLEHKSNPEIADLLSISINTVKVHKNNAKKALQLSLRDLNPLLVLILWEAFQ